MKQSIIKVLIVDDDEDDVMIAREYLSQSESIQFDVTWESDPTQAQEKMVHGDFDVFLIDYAQKLIYNNDSQVAILDNHSQKKNNFIVENALAAIEEKHAQNIAVLNLDQINKSFLLQQDLIIFSLETWKKLVDEQVSWLSDIPSVLIVKP